MLNFAVIGVGRMGKRHAFNLAHGFLRGVRLKAVCDIDAAALDWCRKHARRAARYSDYREMIEREQLDGVIIATPHYSHEEIALYCIEAGVNTLIEKPMAVTTAAAKRIIDCAQRHPEVKAGVSFNQRSNKMYRRAKQLIDGGSLGEIQRVGFTITDWYRSQAYYNNGGWRASYTGEGGGCLINQCIHQLDILQWLVGMPDAVDACLHTRDRQITVENDVSAILYYGAFEGVFAASTHELKGTNRLEIALDGGKIVIGRCFMRVYKHRSQRQVNAQTTVGYGFAPSSLRLYSYGLFRLLADGLFGQQLRSLRAFAQEIRGRGKMLAPIRECLNSVSLLNGLYLAGWRAEKVCLPLDDASYEQALEVQKEREKSEQGVSSC